MRVRHVIASVLAVGALGAQAVTMSGAGAAFPAAQPMRVAPLPAGFAAIEVDGDGEWVFVSSPAASAVTVLSREGTVVATLAVPGAGALLADGPTLYVASTTAGRIDAFDITSRSFLRSYGGGALLKPGTLAKAAGRLWTSSGGCGSWGQLVSIDPATGATASFSPIGFGYCPFLFTNPADPNQLLGFDKGLSPTTVSRINVSSGTPVFEASLRTDNSNTRDGEVLPGGQTFALASGAPYEIRTFGVNPLQPHGVVYPTGHYPNAVTATAANGGLVAAARDATYDNDVDVFRLGDPSAPLLQHDFGSTTETVKDAGLAFNPDGSRLYAVSGHWSGDTARLNVFDLTEQSPPAPTGATLSRSAGATVWGQNLTLTATVTTVGGGPVSIGTVEFRDGTTVLGTATLGTAGTATLTTSALEVGNHTLTAFYAGDATHQPATSAAASHLVSKASSTTVLTSSANPVRSSTPVTFTAVVSRSGAGSGGPGGSVTFRNGAATLGTVALQNGRATLTVILAAGTHTITAAYGGDTHFLASTSPALSQVMTKGGKK